MMMLELAPSLVTRRVVLGSQAAGALSGDTTPCRMTGVTLHSHVHYREMKFLTCSPDSLHVVHDNAGAGGRSSIIARASLPPLRPLRHLKGRVHDKAAPFLLR